MAVYSLYGTELYDDEPRENLNRITGPVVGLTTDAWPRHGGRPMQHLFTLDLEGLDLDIASASGKRLLIGFSPSLHELSVGDGAAIQLRWVTQEEVDANGETTPPGDFVADAISDDRYRVFDVEEVDWELGAGDSFVGGSPHFEEDAPDDLPGGAFILQASYEFPISRENLSLYVFEAGALILPTYSDDELMLSWDEAIAKSSRIVLKDEAPPAGALQKFGGHARGVSSYDVPDGMTHLFTYEWTDHDDWVEDGVAIAVFAKLKKNTNWPEQPGFFETVIIEREALEQWDPEDVPDVPTLPEQTLELVPIAPDTDWRDLRAASFIGPRPAYRSSGGELGPALYNQLQLTEELLPNAPGPGTLYFRDSGGYPWWMPDNAAPQATAEVYTPTGTQYDEETTTAIVTGYRIGFEDWSVDPELLEKLDAAVGRLNAAKGLDLTLFVLGDTTTDPDTNTSGDCVLGRAVVSTSAYDQGPTPFDPAAVMAAIGQIPELTNVDWAGMGEMLPGFVGAKDGPGAFLVSWGPLCYGAVHVGVAMSEDEQSNAKYTYAANQDMEQMWTSEGLDGARIESVEFTDIQRLDLGPDAVKAHHAKVADIHDPKHFLLCRYD